MGLPQSKTEIILRLDDITLELMNAYEDEAQYEAAEHETKVRAWMADDSQYVTSRDRTAEFQAIAPSLDLIHIKGRIRALSEERDMLRLRLQYGAV